MRSRKWPGALALMPISSLLPSPSLFLLSLPLPFLSLLSLCPLTLSPIPHSPSPCLPHFLSSRSISPTLSLSPHLSPIPLHPLSPSTLFSPPLLPTPSLSLPVSLSSPSLSTPSLLTLPTPALPSSQPLCVWPHSSQPVSLIFSPPHPSSPGPCVLRFSLPTSLLHCPLLHTSSPVLTKPFFLSSYPFSLSFLTPQHPQPPTSPHSLSL